MRGIVDDFGTIVNSLKMNFSSLAGLDEMVEESFTALMRVAEIMIVVVTDEVTHWFYLERYSRPRSLKID